MHDKVCQANTLKNMQRAYDFYAKNPGASYRDMAAAMDIPISTAKSHTTSALSRGCIYRTSDKSKSHQHPDEFYIVDGMRPKKFMPRISTQEKRSGVEGFSRRVVRAVQCGMPAYRDLPVEFFRVVVSA